MIARLKSRIVMMISIVSPLNSGISHYTEIIPGEISMDEFSSQIEKLASKRENRYFLEIGSSAGDGSTRAFISQIEKRSDRDECRFYCLEISLDRYQKLTDAYRHLTFFQAFRNSSVPLSDYPTAMTITKFYISTKTNLRNHGLLKVLLWLRREIAYISNSGVLVDESGIVKVLREIAPHNLDVVLIDGSEFTGEAELLRVLGSKYILLDDTESFKCFNAKQILLRDTRYKLIKENSQLRNGYAIFEKIND